MLECEEKTIINKSKTICFKGKHNIDKMNSLDSIYIKGKRETMENLLETDIKHYLQIEMINKLYMDYDFKLKSLFESELNKKLNGYKSQDIKKNIYNETLLINLEETLEKLISSKLRCIYCKCPVLILYKNVREPLQWSLDRIDNNKCHSNINTVISCLKCNLQRRVTNIDKFMFTKHLKINKCQ